MIDDARPAPDPLDDSPLPVATQRANIRRFATFWGLYYFCAPISYIGVTHANLLRQLGAEDDISNLPAAAYQWLTILPVLAAWRFGQARHLRRLIFASLGAMFVATGLVGGALALGVGSRVAIWLTIAHGAAFGAANGVLLTSLWDLLKRGVSTSRRGAALGWTFGLGPLAACAGALLQDALIEGELLGGWNFGLAFPRNYAAMFAAATPALLVAGYLLSRFEIPIAAEPAAETSVSLKDLASGVKGFVANRPVLYAALLYFVVYSGGNAVFPIVSLKADSALAAGDKQSAESEVAQDGAHEATPTPKDAAAPPPKQSSTLGVQSFLRFGCKAIAGVMLGFLLAKASPRATLLATTSILLIGLTWALSIKGWPFLAAAGILGAGELFGAYFPNYVTTASGTRSVRMNMALLSVLGSCVGFSAYGLGAISKEFGRDASIYAAAGVLALALPLIYLLLPAHPNVKDAPTATSPAD